MFDRTGVEQAIRAEPRFKDLDEAAIIHILELIEGASRATAISVEELGAARGTDDA